MRPTKIRATFDQSTRALEMWRGGADTAAIATALGLPEPLIAGLIATMREVAIALRGEELPAALAA